MITGVVATPLKVPTSEAAIYPPGSVATPWINKLKPAYPVIEVLSLLTKVAVIVDTLTEAFWSALESFTEKSN